MESLYINEFNLKQIADSGQCFLWEPLEDGGYAICTAGKYVEAKQTNNSLLLSCTSEEFEQFWRLYFDLDTDYHSFQNAVDPEDHYLSAVIQQSSGIRILRQDLWEVMVSFLISQNNNISRIRNSMMQLCKLYGKQKQKKVSPGTYFTFPRPDAFVNASASDFAAVGLGYRASYMEALVAQMKNGGLADFECSLRNASDEEAITLLRTLHGIGPKVAECICLFGLHRLNRFPIDTHIKKILQKHYPQGFPHVRYEGFAGVLQQYMFYCDLMH